MSEEEENGKVAKKVIDINVNVKPEGKGKDVPTYEQAKALAEQLNAITNEDYAVAKTVADFETQKEILHTELAHEIGQARKKRMEYEALERERGSTASGTATLTGEEATGGSTDNYQGDLPINMREYASHSAMVRDLKNEVASNGEFKKEAQHYLTRLSRKLHKSKQGVAMELQTDIGDIARGNRKVVFENGEWKLVSVGKTKFAEKKQGEED